MGLAGTAIVGYLGYVRLFAGQAIGDRPLLLLGILLLFAGMQLVTLGLLAELQARTYHESQNKPIYVVRDVLESGNVDTLEESVAADARGNPASTR